MRAIGRGTDANNKTSATGSGVVRVRRKIDPSSPPTTLELRGIRVHFPFKPYPCQEAYMGKVLDALFRSENALLESPTGTGKTLCLLCAALAWQRQQQRSLREAAEGFSQQQQQQGTISNNTATNTTNNSMGTQDGPRKAARLPQIIYASRTHSQLSQVVRELRNTRYRPPHAVLASREQMCVNPKVKKKNSTASDINHDCNKLGKERKCRYRNKLEGFVPTPTEHSGGGSGNHQPVMDMEELITMGKTQHVCPFYYTRAQVENAELILVPYNYLFDKDARETTLADVRWENAVVIFDEAHNLESFASESASFDLSNTDIAGCMSEIHKATNIVQSMPDLEYNVKEENLALLLRAFESLENYILLLPNQTAYSGEFMMEIFHKGAGISHENHLLFIEELRKVNDMIMDMRGTGATRGSPRLEHFVTCLKRVYGHKLEARCLAKASSYRVHVSPKTTDEKKNTGRTVSYWCFAPSLAMEELANLNVRSILVTSGTLSPLPSYSMELGLPFAHTLENPHIVKASQVHVRVIGKGVSGKALSSSYERRQDGEYFTELGSTLASLAKVIPAGMLIFFPSYGVMETCIERWGGPSLSRPNKPQGRNAFFAERKKSNATKQYAFPRVVPTYNTDAFGGPNSPWKRLLAAKAIVLEPRSSADLQDAISEFKRFLEMPKSSGCVLMGVCRGKISEGIDFAHDMSRAVIITGIPFPPSFDPKVKMKREYLDYARASAARKPAENAGFSGGQSAMASPAKLSGHEWYTQQAHRAVNQAIGRVIRNMSDYGAVLLLDSRFDQPRNKEGLSRWVRPHVLSDEGFGPAVKALGAFYKEASAEAKVRAESKPLPVEVSYEDERMSDDDSLGEMKSVAVISRGKSNSGYQDSADAQYEDAYVAPDRVTHVEVAGMAKNETSETPKNVQKPFGAQNFDAVFAPRKDNTAPKHSDSTRPAAKIFMEKTLTLMNKKDQSTIRKLIVMTKRHSDSQDVKGFRKSASAIIDMILKAEKHESPPIPDDERMLFLFLELLPSAYRNEFELIALQKLIEISQLGLHCKENLSSADCSRVASAAVAALHLLWFKDDVSDSSFIQHAQVVVSVACKAERLASHTMLRSFLRLLPKDRHEITRRMFDEIESAKRIEQKKQQQKNKVGESAIDMNRFLPANTVNKRAFARHLGENTEAPQAEDTADLKPASQKAAPSQPVSVAAQGQKKAPFNPYKRPDPFNPYKRPKTKPVDSSGPSSSRPTSTKSTPTSISALLKSVESDPYVRQNKASPGAGLKSNAPAGLTCPVCSIQMTKPYLAQCGHMACLACWRDWLKRSETCPTCRTRTNLKSISQAVFKEENSEAAEGSDVQEDHTNAGEEDDGELVFY